MISVLDIDKDVIYLVLLLPCICGLGSTCLLFRLSFASWTNFWKGFVKRTLTTRSNWWGNLKLFVRNPLSVIMFEYEGALSGKAHVLSPEWWQAPHCLHTWHPGTANLWCNIQWWLYQSTNFTFQVKMNNSAIGCRGLKTTFRPFCFDKSLRNIFKIPFFKYFYSKNKKIYFTFFSFFPVVLTPDLQTFRL